MKIPLALSLVVTLSLPAAAQDAKSIALDPNGTSSACNTRSFRPTLPPSLCKPCAFYGGDPNDNDPDVQAFANGNTLAVPDTATYAAVTAPDGTRGVITGILFVSAANSSADFDPDIATYDIRIGVSDGNGGTSVASGSGPMPFTMYGQCPIVAYQTAVTLTSPLRVTPGTTYWFNLSPQCTNSGNSNCSQAEFFLYNTTQETDGLHAGAQPHRQLFFNSASFGYTWKNWCDPSLGQNAKQCARASFGLMGHK